MHTIDITPTWGEWGTIYRRFAESGETAALRALAKDFSRAMALAEAMRELTPSLSDDQAATLDRLVREEMRKQGFDRR